MILLEELFLRSHVVILFKYVLLIILMSLVKKENINAIVLWTKFDVVH